MQQCGFCSMLSGLMRRAMCMGSRRGSSDSYYRELGDQETLKVEDKSSNASELSEELKNDVVSANRIEDSQELCKMTSVNNVVVSGRFLTMRRPRKKQPQTPSLIMESGLLEDLQPGQVNCILNQSVLWRFNAFTLDNASGGRCLPVLCDHLFHMYGLISHFKLDVAKAWRLFSLIDEGYHSSNPYHNSVHAVDVTQAMHCFLQQKQIRDFLEPQEVLASLLAAIAHDMDHPGVNQPFLIATSNHLAALYKNTSVLENHHWRSAVSCLMESGLLSQSKDLQAKVESQISSLILATDITRQQEYLCQFKTYLDSNSLDMRKADHRHLVLQMALKCADISNPCRPWDISCKWSFKVCEEFFRQGDSERKLNLPVTALCDRHNTTIPKIQTGFFKYVVTPLISEWHRFLQNDLSAQMLKNLSYNKEKWETMMAQEIADEMRTEMSDADVVDDDLDTTISDSSELLLPPRRSSLNLIKPCGLNDPSLRRFSVPLNVGQDSKNKPLSQADSRADSDQSLHSVLSALGEYHAEKILSTEKLLPEPSTASITTPVQAARLSTVLKNQSWKLKRQQTFPPLDAPHDFYALPLHSSNEEPFSRPATQSGQKLNRLNGPFTRIDTDMTDVDNASEFIPNRAIRGSQLRDNLTSVSLDLCHRRKSMPADAITYTPKELKALPSTVPLFLRRTLSNKESWARRRGSAPAPVAVSELRSLLGPVPLRHNSNGTRRKPPAVAACQQWLAKVTDLPRRSSLPAEVMTGVQPY